ncbi:MAG: tetratricopeptide repeat protein [Gammaproteobacteria bacterium]
MSHSRITDLFHTATAQHKSGELQQAEQIYRRILEIDPGHHDTLHYLGLLLRQINQVDAAIDLLARAVRADPNDPMCQSNLGNLLREQGKLPQAVAAYRKAVSTKPDYVDVQFNLATTLRDMGDYEGAVASYSRVLELAPGDGEAWQGLGGVLLSQEQLADAVDAFQRAARLQPREATIQYDLGCAQRSAGHPDAAVEAFRRAIDLRPDYPEACNNMAAALRAQGKLDQALTACREAVRLRPDYHVAYDNLAAIYLDSLEQSPLPQGDSQRANTHTELAGLFIKHRKLDAAVAACREALRLSPDLVEAYNSLGIAYRNLGRLDDAVTAFHDALKVKPEYVDACNNLGFTYGDMGDFDKALHWFHRTLELDPELPEVCLNIARAKRFSPADRDEIKCIEAVLANPRLSEASQACVQFALGKIYADCGDIEQAFSRYERGNRLKHRSVRFDGARHTERVDALINTFTPEFFAARHGFGDESDMPVFIVGMPRSGTTLVEQIVSSHPAVYGAGEQTQIGEIAGSLRRKLNTSQPYPECVSVLGSRVATTLAGEYLGRLRNLAPDARRVTDKMPMNFLHLGLITLLFPRARIVHCRRDPMDTCLSNYIQLFAEGHDFSYDQEDLAVFYSDYHRLMKHWQSALAIKPHEIVYEELIANQEAASRRLMEYCGVPWDDKCLTFHENKRPVQTASQWQVRQPVYRSAVCRWEKYEHHLQPLKQALERNGVWRTSAAIAD